MKIPNSYYRIIYLILLGVLFFSEKAKSQDTIFHYENHPFNVKICYEDTNAVLAYGNYIKGSFIKNGEWIYFYKNGQISKKVYFKKDYKKRIWVYYNKDGTISKTEKWSEYTSEYTHVFEQEVLVYLNAFAPLIKIFLPRKHYSSYDYALTHRQ